MFSSRIEGTEAWLADLALFEAEPGGDGHSEFARCTTTSPDLALFTTDRQAAAEDTVVRYAQRLRIEPANATANNSWASGELPARCSGPCPSGC